MVNTCPRGTSLKGVGLEMGSRRVGRLGMRNGELECGVTSSPTTSMKIGESRIALSVLVGHDASIEASRSAGPPLRHSSLPVKATSPVKPGIPSCPCRGRLEKARMRLAPRCLQSLPRPRGPRRKQNHPIVFSPNRFGWAKSGGSECVKASPCPASAKPTNYGQPGSDRDGDNHQADAATGRVGMKFDADSPSIRRMLRGLLK